MTQTEAMQELIDRYDCEIYETDWGVNLYHKKIHALIRFEEAIQKWGSGNVWISGKQDWSTGEFAEYRKYTTDGLFSVFDGYFPIREEIKLF